MFKKITLKNGLRVIIVPQKSTEAVTILILVGTGSKYEQREISGISHFLEHMFFKGTSKRPSTILIAETLDRVGGIYNAFTSDEYTGYFAKVQAGHFDLALDWVSDIFLNSKLEPGKIEQEKGVIHEEINMHFDNPMTYVQILWQKLLYGDQPAGWDIAGTKETVAKMSKQKLLSYRQNQYTTFNTIVCVAGRVKTLEVLAKIKKIFGGIKTSGPGPKQPVIEKQTKPSCLLEQRKTDQTHLCLGVRSYSLFHSKRYVQEILAVILGGMMSSRLFIKIREKLGIAYFIATSISADTDTGYLVTQAGVAHKKAKSAISAILQEYQRICQEKVSAKELKKAKDYLKGKTALALELSEALASFYGLQELLCQEILTLDQVYANIDKITAGHVLEVAQDLFRPQKLNLALIGPFKEKVGFERLLKI